MTSELITHLTTLIERWDNLSLAAAQKIETTSEPIQGSFYAGVLFGMGVSRDELTAALASAMVEAAKPSTGLIHSGGQPPN